MIRARPKLATINAGTGRRVRIAWMTIRTATSASLSKRIGDQP